LPESHQEKAERCGTDSPSHPSEGTSPVTTMILDFCLQNIVTVLLHASIELTVSYYCLYCKRKKKISSDLFYLSKIFLINFFNVILSLTLGLILVRQAFYHLLVLFASLVIFR
jgi:hypothetical protein